MKSRLRVLYMAGFADVIGTYRYWQSGMDDPRIPDVAYSRQFFDVCERYGADALVISSNPHVGRLRDGLFQIEHRPILWGGKGGLLFHLGQALYGMGLARRVLEFRADMVVVAGTSQYWFLMSLPAALGVKIVPVLHGTLWLAERPPTLSQKLLLSMARPLFARQAFAILSHPGTCVRQVLELTGGRSRPVVPFIPFYREETFAGIPEHGERRPPFRVLFVGRVEVQKGVFDLVEIARQLRDRGRVDIEFDLCGTGSVAERLRQAAVDARLDSRFRCHGHVEMDVLREMLGRSHVVVVPTRTKYTEGFNAVVAEAILSGRPVITSRVCPAIELVRDAVVEVAPEDVAGYRDAIVSLADDGALYEAKKYGCAPLKAQFCDPNRSWGAALVKVIEDALR
jgi:glycogen(starch) synthase